MLRVTGSISEQRVEALPDGWVALHSILTSDLGPPVHEQGKMTWKIPSVLSDKGGFFDFDINLTWNPQGSWNNASLSVERIGGEKDNTQFRMF